MIIEVFVYRNTNEEVRVLLDTNKPENFIDAYTYNRYPREFDGVYVYNHLSGKIEARAYNACADDCDPGEYNDCILFEHECNLDEAGIIVPGNPRFAYYQNDNAVIGICYKCGTAITTENYSLHYHGKMACTTCVPAPYKFSDIHAHVVSTEDEPF